MPGTRPGMTTASIGTACETRRDQNRILPPRAGSRAHPRARRGDGDDDPGLEVRRGGLSRRALQGFPPRSARQQRPVDPHATEGDRGHPCRIPARGRRHRRHQHVFVHLDRASRLRSLQHRLRAEPPGRETGEGRGGTRHQGRRQAAFRRRCPRSDQPHRVDLAGRVEPRLPRRHLRRTARGLWRTGARAAGWRRRRPPARDHFRYAERQGGALRHLRDF